MDAWGGETGNYQLDITPCAPALEVCDNGLDDDGDGDADCDDADCAGDPSCLVVGACPDQDLGSALGDSVASGNTTAEQNSYAASCGGGAASPDQAFTWTVPADG